MTSVSPNVRPVYLLVKDHNDVYLTVGAVSTNLQRLKDAVADLVTSCLWKPCDDTQTYIIRASTYVEYGPRIGIFGRGVLPCTEDGAVNEDDPRMICKCMVAESGGVRAVNFVDNPNRDETCIPSTNDFYVAEGTGQENTDDLFIATTLAHAKRYVAKFEGYPMSTHSISKVDQNDTLTCEDRYGNLDMRFMAI
jgi:hypothetical protein